VEGGPQAEAPQVAPLREALARLLGRDRSPGPVRAGGGVVWRRGPDGRLEVILVHRPKYDDWSLPKGKLHRGEDEAHAALREVEEETGLRCVLGRELPASRYHDRFGRDKTVRYWAMTAVDGSGSSFAPNAEVDEVRWLSPREAADLLSYERDREILRALRVDE
jgi:8-oxo-dGTP diphosphatase